MIDSDKVDWYLYCFDPSADCNSAEQENRALYKHKRV